MYWIRIGTEIAALNSQVVPISQVVLKAGFTVYLYGVALDILLPVFIPTRCGYSKVPSVSKSITHDIVALDETTCVFILSTSYILVYTYLYWKLNW